MSNQQNSSVLQNKEGEPPADNLQPLQKNHCLSPGIGNENDDNGSKTSSQKSKKAEKVAALEKDFSSNLLLKRIEFEMKRKELELELQVFEENGVLILEYQKEALDINDFDSEDDAAPSLSSRSPFKWKEIRNRDIIS